MEKGEVIGEGRTAEVIYWGKNTVLKLFYKEISSELIDYQFKVDTLIANIYSNCPKAYEKIEENGRIGILYEYIEGRELRELMGNKLKTVGKALKLLAEMHADMHKYEISDILSQKNSFKVAIQRTDLLDSDQKRKIMSYMENLSDGNMICHGDLHPENIIVSKNKNYVIDWSNAYSGNPNGDVARTYYVLKYGLAPSDEYTLKRSFFHRFFFKRIKSLIAKTYIKHYIKLTGISLEEIRRWDLAIFAARLREPVPLEYENLLKRINKKLKRLKSI